MLFGLRTGTSLQTHLRLTLRLEVALLVCLFLLFGCNAEDKETSDSDKSEKIESGQPPGDEIVESEGNEKKMEYKTKELLKGFKAPSVNQKMPRLTIFHTQTAWEKYKQAHVQENENLAGISVDWAVSVILLIDLKPTGGMEATPYISALVRTENTVDLAVDWKIDENVPMLDVELQPWLISEAPAEAFAGNPRINFTVKNSDKGEVSHER